MKQVNTKFTSSKLTEIITTKLSLQLTNFSVAVVVRKWNSFFFLEDLVTYWKIDRLGGGNLDSSSIYLGVVLDVKLPHSEPR